MMRERKMLIVSNIVHLGVLVAFVVMLHQAHEQIDKSIKQTDEAITIAKDWEGIAMKWRDVSFGWQEATGHALAAAESWKSVASDAMRTCVGNRI